jgi:hypothetical protein
MSDEEEWWQRLAKDAVIARKKMALMGVTDSDPAADLRREAERAGHVNDPMQHVLGALANGIDAMQHVLGVLANGIDAMQRPAPVLSPAAEKQLVERVARDAPGACVQAVRNEMRAIRRSLDMRTLALAAGGLLAAAAGGLGGGYWLGYSAASSAHLLATCQGGEIRTMGSRRYCIQAVWLDAFTPMTTQKK